MTMLQTLNGFRKNIFSQNGEDGVLCEILKQLGITHSNERGPYWCCEFGAWDGKYLSNTFNLVKEYGWNAVMIEGNKERFIDLERTAQEYSSIIAVHAFVDHKPDSEYLLDKVLKKTPIPIDFELLSIDIDSDDLAVWEAFNEFNPKIVVIEINSSIPPGILMWHSVGKNGNSFSSTLSVACKKGYSFVCHTGNMIFVRNDLLPKIKIDKIYLSYPELLFDPSWYNTGSVQPPVSFLRRVINKQKRIIKKLIGKRIWEYLKKLVKQKNGT